MIFIFLSLGELRPQSLWWNPFSLHPPSAASCPGYLSRKGVFGNTVASLQAEQSGQAVLAWVPGTGLLPLPWDAPSAGNAQGSWTLGSTMRREAGGAFWWGRRKLLPYFQFSSGRARIRSRHMRWQWGVPSRALPSDEWHIHHAPPHHFSVQNQVCLGCCFTRLKDRPQFVFGNFHCGWSQDTDFQKTKIEEVKKSPILINILNTESLHSLLNGGSHG